MHERSPSSFVRSVGFHGLALVALAAFLVGWDLWAVTVDQRPGTSVDSLVEQAALAVRLLQDGDLSSLWALLLRPKGPVGPLLGALLLWAVPVIPLGVRLVSVLAHGALVLQTFFLGRRLTGSATTGLWCALICGTLPMVFGWGRLAYHDALLAAEVMGALQLMLWARLRRPWPAMVLGGYLALGVMTKPSFIVFLAAPGAWFLLRWLRDRRAAWMLLVMLATMAVVLAPWIGYMAAHHGFEMYVSTARPEAGLLDVLLVNAPEYLRLPGTWPLLLTALVSLVVLWLRRSVDRWDLALPGSFLLVSVAVFFTCFHVWSRYILPIYPAAAVLAGLGIGRAQLRLPAAAGRAAGGLLAAALLGIFVLLNLTGLQAGGAESPLSREEHCGMVSPERRPYEAYARAVGALRRHGRRVLVVYHSHEALSNAEREVQIWSFRGVDIVPLSLVQARRAVGRGETISVLRVLGPGGTVRVPGRWPEHRTPEMAAAAWLSRQTRVRRLLTAVDPDGRQHMACRVGPGP